MPDARPANRRTIGMVLLASAAVLGLVAIFFGTGVIPLQEQTRMILALAMGLAAAVDVLIGLRFLLSSNS